MFSRSPIIGSFANLIEAAPSTPAPASQSALDLLLKAAQISDGRPSLPVGALFEHSGLKLDQFAEFLTSLDKNGFVEKSGDWGREDLVITPVGQTVIAAAATRAA